MLGAGGTKGWAHAGVMEVLHDAGVPVDLIVGASAGALIGPLYAARRDAIEAALKPASVDYLYYVLSDDSGRHAFATTYEQFLEAKRKARRDSIAP